MRTCQRVPFSRVHYPITLLVLGVLAAPPEASAQNNSTLRRPVSGHLAVLLSKAWANSLAPSTSASNSSTGVNMSASLPPTYFPAAGGGCSKTIGTNIKVNQNCQNLSDFPGQTGDADEPAIAQDPNNPSHLVAASNTTLFGNFTLVETYYSLDGGQHWSNSTPPIGETVSNAFGGSNAFGSVGVEFWQAFADPSLAWDTQGNAYLAGIAYQIAAFPGLNETNNPDASSAVYVFRSTLNNGASWNFTARPVFEYGNAAGKSLIVEDKPYMTVDNHVGSPFKDRIYVTWDEIDFSATGPEYVWESYSDDYGETFSPRVLVSGNNTKLCTDPHGFDTPQGNCNLSYYPQPFTGPDGALYVVFGNQNNPVSATPSNCPGQIAPGNTNPCDNHLQILLAKSTDGGVSFSLPVKVADYYDLPDCPTYQAGQGYSNFKCVPEKGASTNSVFDAINYPVGAVHPQNPKTVAVTVPSYINVHSNESKGCVPQGTSPATGNGLFTGVKTPGACNNDILVSVSNDGGLTFTGGRTDVRLLPSVTQGADVSDQFRQWAAFTRSGEFVVSYYDRRYGNNEMTGSMDISASGSYDGIHFATKRVTSSSMPLPTQYLGLFFGDYAGLSGVDDVHPIWTDTRDPQLLLCPGTAKAGVPPAVCRMTAPNGISLNNQEIFTSEQDPP
jgi:hypothetical protein